MNTMDVVAYHYVLIHLKTYKPSCFN